MKASRDMKRLYVGGLGHNISEADLQNQFSRFGEVSDVEIITRKDNQGNPQKIFAYINIRVGEADLKKCMSALNKTKWKGGTLQIQLAKESFLHRLAQEREAAKSMKEKSTDNTNLSEKIRGVDFSIKAVPGTEVPGHKNWVVSKFGRVLPVLHLKNEHKRKIIKYDPSKYCHNLKKIGEDFTGSIPITNLTWELEGGNDPMSKKRRGEFSDFHCPPKKIMKVQKDIGSTGSLVMKLKPNLVTKTSRFTQQEAAAKTPYNSITSESIHVPDSDTQKLKNTFFQNSSLKTTRNKTNMSDDDVDSEDELRQLIAREENLEKTRRASVNESENDLFEVVKEDFKSDVHKLHSFTGLGTDDVSCLVSDDNVTRNNCDYDSGDTDEIIAVKKKSVEIQNSTEFSQMKKTVHKKTLKSRKDCKLSDSCIKVQKRNDVEVAIHQAVKPLGCKSSSNSSSSEDADSLSELAESADEDYNSMMKNCLRVNLTLADLEQLAKEDLKPPGEKTEVSVQQTTTTFDRTSKTPRTPNGFHRGQRCIHPEEIVASLLEGEENTCGKQKPKESNLKPKFQAFKGVGCLYGKESLNDSVATNNINKNQHSMKLEDASDISLEKAQGSSDKTPFQQPKKANVPNCIEPQKKQSTFENQDLMLVSSSNSEKGSENGISSLLPLNNRKSSSRGAKTPKVDFDDFDKDSCHQTTETEEDSGKKPDLNSRAAPEKSPAVASRKDIQGSKTNALLSAHSLPEVNAKQKHAEDNQRRLAALEARQKVKEVQKKLVHDALAKLDGHQEDKSTHIIFGSDSESETEVTSSQENSHPREEPVKASAGKSSGKLFDSSDDEESGPEDDSDRFRIKPQFEGRAGLKLMNLQSHFGADDRFRMDSRFLESDSEEEQEEICENKTAEEEELAAEKQKALNVVQSVLHINLSNPASKGSVAAKKFKDIVRYDPTRQDHAAYERKKDDKPKESKAKRKKKREEAEKLPEVSKEMYYNITTDLKEIFQSTKDTSEKNDSIPWNEDPREEVQDSATSGNGAQQPGGFTFSFFDSDAEDVKEDTYRIETVKPGKVAWQGAPHFHDSSSEEEDEDVIEESEDKKPSPVDVSLPEKETTRFFFFSKMDERLNAADLFWRGVRSSISRGSWEARTDSLWMDCRKKHKDAKRRVKPN